MKDIDSVLLPYANSQPNNVKMNSTIIERIPMIADEFGILPKFQEFYNSIVNAIMYSDYESLYEISDKVLEKEKFLIMIQDSIGNVLNDVLKLSESCRGIDIELNIGRFNAVHRNLIGGFYIIFYTLNMNKYEGIEMNQTELVQKSTELLFTYKNDEFVILSHFTPFISEQ